MSYILFASSSISTPVSVANGGTGANSAQASLVNILLPQDPLPPIVPDLVPLTDAVQAIAVVLQTAGLVNP